MHGEIRPADSTDAAILEGPTTGFWRVASDDIASAPRTAIRVSSSIGLIAWNGGELLPFLIAIRTIVELDTSIDERIASLRAEIAASRWRAFNANPVFALPKIVDLFFPSFLRRVPGLPAVTILAMHTLNLDTPAKILATDEATLLALKGIGPATLATLIKACRRSGVFQHASRIDAVER